MDKTVKMINATLGKNEIVRVPLKTNKVKNTIGFFKKKEGKFEEVTNENLMWAIEQSIPLFSITFKSKKSINELIRFLRWYRDNEFKTKE